MKEISRSKRLHAARVYRADKSINSQTSTGSSGTEYVAAKQSAPKAARLLRPGQELLICLGWLRLFQRIVAPELSAISDWRFRPRR